MLAAISHSRRPALGAIETWSSWLAEVGRLSTLAGWASALLSLASAAQVTWAIMKPEFTPPLATRKAGSCDMLRSTSSDTRRSASEPISAIASARLSAAIATGSAWKLPPERMSFSSANTSGLSETALDSISSTSAAWRIWVRQAPMTWGWQRSEYGSCTLSQAMCDCAISLLSPSRWR